MVVAVVVVAGCLHAAISFRLFNIFKEKVQFKAMSPAKTRTCNTQTQSEREIYFKHSEPFRWIGNRIRLRISNKLDHYTIPLHDMLAIRNLNRFLKDFNQVPSFSSKSANPFGNLFRPFSFECIHSLIHSLLS